MNERKPFNAQLGMRHIQDAVCTARRWRLVKPDVLVAAGYREKGRRR